MPSFADADMSYKELPFANSLTITNDDFANRLHNDDDELGFAYGIWWPASKSKSSRYRMTRKSSHSSIKAGSFLISDYGVLIDFEK